MFKFFSNLAHSASELLAPNLRPEEELFLQWHNLVKELKLRKGANIPVDDTDVPLRLQWIFNLIQQDTPDCIVSSISAPNDSLTISPCLEFVMRYKVFDWLVALAKTDKPAGIKSYVLFFLTNFVRTPSTIQIIPKSFMYKPLSRLIMACGRSSCSPWDREEMAFLRAVVDVLAKDQCLANLFLHNAPHDAVDRTESDVRSVDLPDCILPENEDQNRYINVENSRKERKRSSSSFTLNGENNTSDSFTFPLLTSLLRSVLNPDPVVSAQAREATIQLLRCREPVVCHCIAQSRLLEDALLPHFSKLYSCIPATLEAVDVLLRHDFGDLQHVVKSFVRWVVFLDQIITSAEPALTSSFLNSFYIELTSRTPCSFQQDWLCDIPARNDLSVAVFLKMYRISESLSMLETLSNILLNDCFFQKYLIFIQDREMRVIAFDLLNAMVQKPTLVFVEKTMLQFLDSRLYIRKDQRIHDTMWNTNMAEATDRADMFRILFPTSAKSCTVMEEDRDNQNYLRESYYSIEWLNQRCTNLKWPTFGPIPACNVLLAEESAFFDGQPFNEGPLLRVLFHYLSNLFVQPYLLNLRVTGILSKLCLIPHPTLGEYLLDPTVPLAPQSTSLYRSLVSLVQKMDEYARHTPGFRDKIVTTRQLIRDNQWSQLEKDDENVMLCAVVTLEEFCKELAARTFVRFNSSLHV
ncbi:hypothetical protein RvY_00131 [Ramazzottius varieornatus]|uniref:FHF complex subunit HOOK-interacting protein C-terminal domain-containing protein n=1 Tax=Ramazzottius varieornatus TaxID=947166 RepID=A0A1D1UFE4_RAMVA|nr:hypothetical protein RvY_00131 [Ramazzottius varieornatus]